MMRSPRLAKTMAAMLAITAHGALALSLVLPEAPRIEGADGASEVRLGTAFHDMAAGTLAPTPAEARAETVTPDAMTAERPEQAEAQDPATGAPVEAESATEQAHARPVDPATPETAQIPVAPSVPEGTLTAAEPAPVTSEQTAERLEGSEADATGVSRSLRPRHRSAEMAAAHAARPDRHTADRSRATPGNAERHARAGETTGKAETKARQSGSTGRQQAAGNAAASNYPGLVMRRLSRAGKPRVNARGAALVAFTIGPAGGLASVSLARSSGSAALDQAAIRLVQSAGPFPQPPQGARRSFSIQVQGRS